jgi:hypothetical protein
VKFVRREQSSPLDYNFILGGKLHPWVSTPHLGAKLKTIKKYINTPKNK